MQRYTKTEIQCALDDYRAKNPHTPDRRSPTTSNIELAYLYTLESFSLAQSEQWGQSPSRAGDTRRLIEPLQLKQDLRRDLSPPILTARQVWWRGALAEALWMWQGRTSLAELDAILPGASVLWESWAFRQDRLAARVGPHVGTSYGFQFRDALPQALDTLRRDLETRRACLSLWQDMDLPLMALPPCHGCFIQFRAIRTRTGKVVLCLDMTQRSVDTLVGMPFNLLQYYTLLRLVALWLNITPAFVTYTFNDVHVYEEHDGQRRAMLDAPTQAPPSFNIVPTQINLEDWQKLDAATMLHHVTLDWFQVANYKHSGKLLFNVTV